MGTTMFWRTAVTATVWALGFGSLFLDGQVFRNTITMLVTAVIASLPWIRLAFSRSGTRGRVIAVVIVSLSVVAVLWMAFDLPQAYESQKRFNEMHGR